MRHVLNVVITCRLQLGDHCRLVDSHEDGDIVCALHDGSEEVVRMRFVCSLDDFVRKRLVVLDLRSFSEGTKDVEESWHENPDSE